MRSVSIPRVMRHAFRCCGVPELLKKGRVRVELTGVLTSSLADAEYFPKEDYGLIRLSEIEWKKLTRDQQTELLTHECCHVVVDYLHNASTKIRHHGEEWKNWMRACGYPEAQACLDV